MNCWLPCPWSLYQSLPIPIRSSSKLPSLLLPQHSPPPCEGGNHSEGCGYRNFAEEPCKRSNEKSLNKNPNVIPPKETCSITRYPDSRSFHRYLPSSLFCPLLDLPG